MTRRMRQRIGTKSNAKGEVRRGDGEYCNQTQPRLPGWPDREAKCDRNVHRARFSVDLLRRNTETRLSVKDRKAPWEPNGKCRLR